MEETITEGPKRPQFLTVLCILTYIGVGIGIIGSLIGWWGMRKMSDMMVNPDGDSMPDMSNMPNMDNMMNMMKYSNVILISGIAGCLVCLLGALQMWNQKKMGFYIYVVGEIAPVIVSIVCLGAAQALTGWSIIGVIIPLVFIVLYGLNLKHMN